jgi:hypothetical protein
MVCHLPLHELVHFTDQRVAAKAMEAMHIAEQQAKDKAAQEGKFAKLPI